VVSGYAAYIRAEWRQFHGSTVFESLLALLLSERTGIEAAGRTSPSLAAAVVCEKVHRRLSNWEGGQAA
jgi:hypothetical protein